MNFFHLNIGHVSRSTGRSAVQNVAYITGEVLYEDRRQQPANYANNRGKTTWETLAPLGSGIEKDDLSFWNKLENFEDAYARKRFKNPTTLEKYLSCARTGHTYELSLPKELREEQNIELVRDLVLDRFVSKGLMATYAINWNEGNPHVHITVSSRTVWNGEISWDKAVARLLTSQRGFRESRKIFAEFVNKHQELAGIPDRVDHRSYAERGIDLLPTRHKGYQAHQLELEGFFCRIAASNAEISEENKERIAQFPSIVLKELTSKQATFSERDVVRLVQDRMKGEVSILSDHVIYSVLKESVDVGIGFDDLKRYTSPEYKAREDHILSSLEAYREQTAAVSISKERVEELLGGEASWLNEEQKNAVRILCGDAKFSVLVGRAGTGKTTALKYVVQLHQKAGYAVWGMAPSATAAHELKKGAGCDSDTIAHHAWYWKFYHDAVEQLKSENLSEEDRSSYEGKIKFYKKYLPDEKTLILVDEIGMVGVGGADEVRAGGWDALIKTVNATGAKFAVVGDDHQFKPVESGDVSRKVFEGFKGRENFCTLKDIQRQFIPWMKEASNHLSELRTDSALELYEHQGHVQEHETDKNVYEDMAQQYLRNLTREPDTKSLVMAYTNAEVQALNHAIRQVLKDNDFLPQEDLLTRGGGAEAEGYAMGDKVVFTHNDRGFWTKFKSPDPKFMVRNGMRGRIESIKPCQIEDRKTGKWHNTHRIVVRVEGEEKVEVSFTLREYSHFCHGYAITTHKSQGATEMASLLKLSPYMDAYALYVALTRHRQDISIYYSKEDFANFQELLKSVGKVSPKDLAVDYSVLEEHKDYWVNIQDYKALGFELASIRAFAKGADTTDKVEHDKIWASYEQVQKERKEIAEQILENWDDHRDFARQARLTRESLEIAAGHRKRPLSRLELQAQVVVEQYANVAIEARQVWRTIRRTHPGTRAKTHPEWEKFEQLRDTRGALANQIMQNPVLYRPFLREATKDLEHDYASQRGKGGVSKGNLLGYGISIIKAQSEAHQSKMLQKELLTSARDPALRERLQTLLDYIEARDLFATLWQDLRPKLKQVEGTLLAEGFSKEVDDLTASKMARDQLALKIVDSWDGYEGLLQKVGIKLDFSKLYDQKDQAVRDNLFKAYTNSEEEMPKLEAAFEIKGLMDEDAALGKKITVAQVYQKGLSPKDIAKDALAWQKLKVSETLTTEEEKRIFRLLDEYDGKCRKADEAYSLCANDVKAKRDQEARPWHSAHYADYKVASEDRNAFAMIIFDQRNHAKVLSIAELMGMKFKDVELGEIFSRCEQAERTRHITAYLKGDTFDAKGEAARTLRQMVALEKRDASQGSPPPAPSPTARQAHFAGIDFKELQQTAFEYGRASILNGLQSEQEIKIYHTLELYENAYRPANTAYKECLEEGKKKNIKPWETEKFGEYLSLVKIQDERAYTLVKEYPAYSVEKIAEQMRISNSRLDVEAHRHTLRQTLQNFTDGDRTNVPMAALDLMNWLEFDHHGDFKHTFKVLREQDVWPDQLHKTLNTYIASKKLCRKKGKREALSDKNEAHNPDYEVITYERQLSFNEVNEELKYRMYELATHVLGKEPTKRSSMYLKFGNRQSLSVTIAGPNKGFYISFETNDKGGPIQFIKDQLGLPSNNDARKWAIDWLGGNRTVVEHKVIEKEEVVKRSTWAPITPVPKGVENPDIAGNKYLNYMLKESNRETARHAYRDEQGNLLGYVFRFEKPNPEDPGGKPIKMTPPLAYCQNERGFKAWQWKGFETKNRTPYGLEKLAQEPGKPILVVEGEKTADVAQKLLPEYHVLTWAGGAGAVSNTNWKCLIGKDVTIWPDYDYDQGGQKAAEKLQKIVSRLNQEAGKDEGIVGIVKLPDYVPDRPNLLPNKWDLADALPESWTVDTVHKMIHTARLEAKEALLSKNVENGTENKDTFKKNTNEVNYNSQEQKILSYLRKEITIENSPWLEEVKVKRFIKAAEENPARMLHRWQKITDDYSFDPSKTTPQPFTEQQKQAQQLLASVEGYATPKMLREWNTLLENSPQEVIKGCHNLMEKHKMEMDSLTQDARCELAARKFLSLCEQFENVNYNDPRFKKVEVEIEKLASAYLNNEQFMGKIKGSGNENAIERMNRAVQEQERTHTQGLSLEQWQKTPF